MLQIDKATYLQYLISDVL